MDRTNAAPPAAQGYFWGASAAVMSASVLYGALLYFSRSAGVDYPGFSLPDSCLPIFYSSQYNMGFGGYEEWFGIRHSFDVTKYKRIFNMLIHEYGILKASQVIAPPRPSDEQLLLVHTEEYLNKLATDAKEIARIAEVGALEAMPLFALRHALLTPVRYAVGGSVLAAKAALQRGWAINLGGGFHHAYRERGGGFCFFADITLAVRMMQQHDGVKKVMIIDLDAHQGNGHERDFADETEDVFILDMYNEHIYPQDHEAKRAIGHAEELPSEIGDEEYLERLRSALDASFERFAPQVIVYNAGTDCLQGDMLGHMSVSEEGIVLRDEIVFGEAIRRRLPIVMLLSGGYQMSNAEVIAHSIANLNEKFDLFAYSLDRSDDDESARL